MGPDRNHSLSDTDPEWVKRQEGLTEKCLTCLLIFEAATDEIMELANTEPAFLTECSNIMASLVVATENTTALLGVIQARLDMQRKEHSLPDSP